MIAKLVRIGLIVTFLGLLGATIPYENVHALDVPPRPTDIPIVDQTNTLTDTQKKALAIKIADEREKSGNQIAILLVSSLGNGSIEEYSLDVARQWGVGTKENNNGVLLLIAKQDRKLRIEVGRGLEGALTDVQAGRIIRNDIRPQFQKDNYYQGINAGLSSIIAAINGEYVASLGASEEESFPWLTVLVIGFMLVSWVGSMLARTKSWWAGGVLGVAAGGLTGLYMYSLVIGVIGAIGLGILGLILDKAVSANYSSRTRRGEDPSWWAGGGYIGGGGSSGGSGGFGGFGGGGFGGGGAGGDW